MFQRNINTGIWFDAIALATGILMSTLLVNYFKQTAYQAGAVTNITAGIMAFTVVCYTTGAWFYRKKVWQYFSGHQFNALHYFLQIVLLILLLMHLAIFVVIGHTIVLTIHQQLQSLILDALLYVVFSILPNLIIVYTLFRIKNSAPTKVEQMGQYRLGYFLLIISSGILQVMYWNVMTLPMTSNLQVENTGGKLIFTLLMFVLFLLVYLPPRILFLIQDYKQPQTWISITLVFLPTALYILL